VEVASGHLEYERALANALSAHGCRAAVRRSSAWPLPARPGAVSCLARSKARLLPQTVSNLVNVR
jgi:hypothetical protein